DADSVSGGDLGAAVDVLARRSVVSVKAVASTDTGVIGAGVAVVAILGGGGRTRAALACVAHRAGVGVVAGRRVVHVDAAAHRVTAVVGAGVPVVASRRRSADAGAGLAAVARGAGVAVVAGRSVDAAHSAP